MYVVPLILQVLKEIYANSDRVDDELVNIISAPAFTDGACEVFLSVFVRFHIYIYTSPPTCILIHLRIHRMRKTPAQHRNLSSPAAPIFRYASFGASKIYSLHSALVSTPA